MMSLVKILRCLACHRRVEVVLFLSPKGAKGFFGDFEHTNAAHAAGRAGEVLVDGFGVDADGFKQLRSAVGHVGRHAHLGHDL